MTTPAILVPVKDPENSKKRLAPVLPAEQRAELVRCLTRDVLEDLSEFNDQFSVGIITSSGEIAELTQSYGISVVEEAVGCETLGAVVDRSAKAFMEDQEGDGLLVFPVDLPRLDVEAIREILNQARDEKVLFVPDHENEGTNALWRRPWDRISCQYEGTASFEQHLAVAREQGIEPEIIEDERFAFDLDSPDDWYLMLEEPERISSHTRSFVQSYLVDIPSSIPGGP